MSRPRTLLDGPGAGPSAGLDRASGTRPQGVRRPLHRASDGGRPDPRPRRFDEEVVIAGLLHDLVEDTDVALDESATTSATGSRRSSAPAPRPSSTPRGGNARGSTASATSRDRRLGLARRQAVVLADKLHNLASIRLDLAEGRAVWSTFNAGRDQVLWYHRAMIAAASSRRRPRAARLADECRDLLAEVERLGVANSVDSPSIRIGPAD